MGELWDREYVRRDYYLNRLEPFIGQDVIKVLVGQRRVGKSYLLYQVIDILCERFPGCPVVYINKERHEFDDIRNANDLIDYVEARRDRDGTTFLLIDEIQDIDEFERALRHFQAGGEYDIYCTGSNAQLLSGELSTLLAGRYVEIKVFGLSYPEFLQFHGRQRGRDVFREYLRFGGLPYLMNLPLEQEVVFDYLSNILDAILFKDVVQRYDIRNVDFLERLTHFLADNVGSEVSARSISRYLKSQNIRVSHNLVLNYLSHLCNAMLVFKVRRSDVQGKKVFEVGEKYYFEDLGVRHALIGYRATDINKVLENVIYLHLRMAGYEVSVGKMDGGEIDFVCRKDGDRIYVQVAYVIADEEVREREFGNLLAINDNYPKYVVTMDEAAGGSYEGIEHVHVEEFVYGLLKS
ncbi:MAG: ATP-binding protein [Planctomycetota bacterium]